jgi:SPX domain protein involved in polyphosphate accumulation
MNNIMTFKRREIKYLLDDDEYNSLKERLQARLVEDEHGRSTICNIYYDTPDFRIIRKSLEKPVYKEKLRLRSYGTAGAEDKVFVELKKKYNGIVYKRRETLTLAQSDEYLAGHTKAPYDTQIFREIDWFRDYYGNLKPAMYISYEREAYYSLENLDLRITFDRNIMYRSYNLSLAAGVEGESILEPGQHLMELKAGGAIPVWLTKVLDELGIYPASFSKYGRAYLSQVG